ncbi:MAG: acyl carrier protein, partial [Planctomycetota bacterium]
MAPNETDISAALIHYITSELIGDPSMTLGADDDLLATEFVDSLGVMRLISFMEREFEITVAPEHVTIEHFGTVKAMSAYVQVQG